MNKTPYKVIVSIALLLLVSACGGKAAKKETVESTEDITRPPKISSEIVREKEKNPEETVSFDRWKKGQEAPSDAQ